MHMQTHPSADGVGSAPPTGMQDEQSSAQPPVLPARLVQGRMATVAVNEFLFKQPVRVGDILSFFARIVKVGRTSVTVEVEVFAERFALQGQYIKVTEARLTYVAIDSQGKPCPVPAE